MGSAQTAVVLLGHGSRVEDANRGLRAVARSVAAQLGVETVEAAFLQFATPTLEEAASACVAAGARRVAVVPFFLFSGAHVLEDIPAALARLRRRFPDVEFRLSPVLGGHPKLAEAAAERVKEVLG
ncbi:MAG: CbiX/SirB N-terminal domain-containing protein [Deferrisomatales bacterium]